MRSFLRLFLLVLVLPLAGHSLFAQNYKWVKGGGSQDYMGSSRDDERVTEICTDDNRNVYIISPVGDNYIRADSFHVTKTVFSGGGGVNPHLFIASYDCNGNMRWGKVFDAYNWAYGTGLAYSNGSIYISGFMYSDTASSVFYANAPNKYFGYDTIINDWRHNSFIAKYDTGGRFKWVRFVGANNDYTYSHSYDVTDGSSSEIAIDGNDNIHRYYYVYSGVQLSPMATSITGTYDMKYDSLGNLLSAIRLPIDTFWAIKSVVINKKSNTAYAIVNNSQGGKYQDYLAAYNANDIEIWNTDSSSVLNGLVYDGYGSIYGGGLGDLRSFTLSGDTITRDRYDSVAVAVLYKMDTFGHIKIITPFYSNVIGAFGSVALFGSDKIAATGVLAGLIKQHIDSIITPSGEGQNPLFIVIDTSGKLIKLDQLHGDGFYDWGSAIASDKAGDIYIGGQVAGHNIHTDSISYTSNGGNSDFFVMKYGYNCNCMIATEPTPNFSYSGSGSVNFSYTGSVSPDSVRWDFGDGFVSKTLNPTHNFHDTGEHHVCLTVFTCDSGTYCSYIQTTTGVPTITWMENVTVYPNPVRDQLFIEGAENGTRFELINIVGQHLLSGLITDNKQSINVSNLIPGMYIIQLINANGKTGSTRIVKQ